MIIQFILKVGGYHMETILNLIASFFYSLAEKNVNTTCVGPAFQPKEPACLKSLKK